MLKITGILLNLIDKSEYKKEDGLVVPTKGKLQLLLDERRANGTITKVLHTISVPDEKLPLYKDKINKVVEVDVGIISKQFSFYGV
jgi:hypothetical protein